VREREHTYTKGRKRVAEVFGNARDELSGMLSHLLAVVLDVAHRDAEARQMGAVCVCDMTHSHV